jgi:hypothetical protein
MPTVFANGINIHYEEYGEKDKPVLVKLPYRGFFQSPF